MEEYCEHVDEGIRDSIISFTRDLPNGWKTQIPDQNLAVDGCAPQYQFEVIENMSKNDEINIFYYVNRPIDQEYFLTIWAYTKDDGEGVEAEIVLSEGSEVADLFHIDREPEYYTIESQEIQQSGGLESYFESIKNVVRDYVDEYGKKDLAELRNRSETR